MNCMIDQENLTISWNLRNCLFGATFLVKCSDKEKHVYSGYGIVQV